MLCYAVWCDLDLLHEGAKLTLVLVVVGPLVAEAARLDAHQDGAGLRHRLAQVRLEGQRILDDLCLFSLDLRLRRR